MSEKVIVGMSGGVDSSVAALLLKRQGYDVSGLFMRNWDSSANRDILGNPDIGEDICPQERDYQDAQAVCELLDIPLHRADFSEEYWRDVFTYFLREYEAGRTPNPDILCNKHIKFDVFIKHASRYGYDRIAMGHYARLDQGPPLRLLRGLDEEKDQTYFLSQLDHGQLKDVLFPIGELPKQSVRKLALEAGFPTADKKDSTGICFIGERDFRGFLQNYLPARSGDIVADDGKKIGTHLGLMHYTIGQRKGLAIGGLKAYGNDPWFVIGKDLKTNTLTVGQGYHHEGLYATACTVIEVNTISPTTSLSSRRCSAKVRYRQKDVDVYVEENASGVRVEFAKPVRAVTPGQACVFYDGEMCLGGGFIDAVYRDGKRLPY